VHCITFYPSAVTRIRFPHNHITVQRTHSFSKLTRFTIRGGLDEGVIGITTSGGHSIGVVIPEVLGVVLLEAASVEGK
jgi:hypothetical protein